MTVRYVDGQEHYGKVGLGSFVLSGADAFSAAQLPTLIEPSFIYTIKDKTANRIFETDIDDIIIWDCREWLPEFHGNIDITGGEQAIHTIEAGLVKENNVDPSVPTADTINAGTHAGGDGAAVTGQAVEGTNTRMNPEEFPEYEARFEFAVVGHEEQTAVGDIATIFSRLPKERQTFSPYESANGITCHNLLTARNYHYWADTLTLAAAGAFGLGMDATRRSIDVEELMMDRNVFLSILDALAITT